MNLLKTCLRTSVGTVDHSERPVSFRLLSAVADITQANTILSAEVVGDGHVVVVERPVQESPPATDMEHEGGIPALEERPERVQVGVGGRHPGLPRELLGG